ncbi:MAG: hypothetical protein LUC45_07195, partial [Paraprevotella sp.]|nr:hypothetical protein [Paraprevotella sp.]
MTHPIPHALCLWLLLFMQTACHSSLPVSRHDLPTRSFTWRGDTLFTAETGNKAARIRLKEQNGALQLTLSPTTSADTSCSIMLSDADSLYLPVGEGKLFSTQDTLWIHHLSGESYSAIADLSMPFIAFSRGLHAYVVVFDHPCRTCIRWSGNRRLRLSIKSEFVSLDSVRQNQMTIYATTNSPVAVARTYQAHIFKQDKHIRTLVQQAETHPNVARLFGAPHFYLWDTSR